MPKSEDKVEAEEDMAIHVALRGQNHKQRNHKGQRDS